MSIIKKILQNFPKSHSEMVNMQTSMARGKILLLNCAAKHNSHTLCPYNRDGDVTKCSVSCSKDIRTDNKKPLDGSIYQKRISFLS